MKCVKLVETSRKPPLNIVVRVTDEVAAQRVSQGWVYCPKSEWKASRVVHTTKEAKLCRSM